jgi:hypothetical protein
VTNDASEVAAYAYKLFVTTLADLPSKELSIRLNRKRDEQDATIPRSVVVVAA